MNIFNRITEIAFNLWRERFFREKSFHVSFAVYQNHIVAIARNNIKTHPLNVRNPRFNRLGKNISDEKGSCSEFRVLQKVKNTTIIPFKKITLITLRINNNGQLANSYPCESCLSLIRFINPKQVYYTNAFGDFVML